MKKRPYLVGNWKMHKTARESAEYLRCFLPLVEKAQAHVLLSVSFTLLASVNECLKGTPVLAGAQNIAAEREGAFTGEVSGRMVKEAGASFVLIGHSERRHLFHEGDEEIRKKVERALYEGLRPILCIGETLQEKEQGLRKDVLERQIYSALDGISKESFTDLLLAYEPVWAIGTGKAASAQEAQEAHEVAKESLDQLFGLKKSAQIPILYGGSVNQSNAALFLKKNRIDGLLVGGASLDPEGFAQLILSCLE